MRNNTSTNWETGDEVQCYLKAFYDTVNGNIININDHIIEIEWEGGQLIDYPNDVDILRDLDIYKEDEEDEEEE